MYDNLQYVAEETSLLAHPNTTVKVILVLEKIIICYMEIPVIVIGYI